jgi:branched-chain amino acid transport system permease protein
MWLALLIDAIVIGSTYSLFSIGLTLIFGVLGIANMAFGAVSMVGGYATWYLLSHTSAPLAVAVIFAGVAGGVAGLVTYAIAIYPLERKHSTAFFAPLLTTIAAGFIFINIVENVFGVTGETFSRLPTTVVHAGMTSIGILQIVSTVVALSLAAVVWYVVKRTTLGLRMRAVQSNRRMAGLYGVSVVSIMAVTLVISSACAGIAGSLIALTYDVLSPESGQTLLFLAFAIVMLAGLGNIRGAVIVSFCVGVVDVAGVRFIGSQYEDVITYGVALVAIVVQSYGLLGKKLESSRV